MANTFADIINSDTPTLVDFSAEWCGPCKMMKPVLADLKSKMGDSVKILKVDVDKNRAIAESLRMQGVPTLILYKRGKALWRQSGVISAQQLQNIISQQNA